MIPKTIHRVHLGPEEPQLVKDAWELSKSINEGWEHVTHNEDSLDNFPISKNYLSASSSYSFKSDLMRFEALYNWGGIYIDTDVFCIKSFEDFVKLDKIVVGNEDEETIGSAIIIAPPKNKKILQILKEMINYLKEEVKAEFIYGSTQSKVFGPRIVTEFWKDDPEVIKLVPEYFYPIFWKDDHQVQDRKTESVGDYLARISSRITKNTYCSHRAAGSWLDG